MFVIDCISFLIFLFTIYELSKDDFIFIRRTISLEQIFNVVFLSAPIALLSARLVYIFLHPSIHFLNPLVFLALPYFPGLSLVGAIVGTWIFVLVYGKVQKIPQGRLLDILGIAFILSFSIALLLQGVLSVVPQRILGLEHIGEGMVGIACAVFLIIQYLKNTWSEGVVSYAAIVFYCILSFVSVGFMLLSHKKIVISSLLLTTALFFISLLFYAIKLGFSGKLLKK